MHNMNRVHKRSGSHSASRAPRSPSRAHSVKDLLARPVPSLSQLADQSARQAYWRGWLASRLPGELLARVSGAVQGAQSLTVFADSAVWAARLRYAVRELEPEIRAAAPGVGKISVRVLPRAGK
jgi:hypothetical protein